MQQIVYVTKSHLESHKKAHKMPKYQQKGRKTNKDCTPQAQI